MSKESEAKKKAKKRRQSVLGSRSMSLGTASLQHMQQIYEKDEKDEGKKAAVAHLHGRSLFCFSK